MSFLLMVAIAVLLLIFLGVFFTIFGIVRKMRGFIVIGAGLIALCIIIAFALLYLITSM